MKKKVCLKISSSNGFSITETLVAMLIMLMVSSIVVGGIPVAQRAYQKVTESANAQVLLSTTITELRNELGLASDITVIDDGKAIKYRSGANGAPRKLYVDAQGIKIQSISVEEFTGIPTSNSGTSSTTVTPSPRLLVTDEAATKNLVIKYGVKDNKITKENGIVTIYDLAVRRKDDSNDLIYLDKLCIDLILDKESTTN